MVVKCIVGCCALTISDVRTTTAPLTLSLVGPSIPFVEAGSSSFDSVLTAIARSDFYGDLSSNVQHSMQGVDLARPGCGMVTFTVQDNEGQSAQSQRELCVRG